MTRYNLTNSPYSISIGSGNAKVIIQALDVDMVIAYDEMDFDSDNYFTIGAGSTLILDQPVPSATQLLWVRTLVAATGIVEVWIT